MKRENPIPENKLKSVKELTDLIKNKKTILIASIKNLPASQFQEIGKKLRGKAIVKVPKKNLLFRAIDSSGNEEVKKIKEYVEDSIAILFSDLDSFDLAAELIKNKSPAKAKAGQESPMDIEVQAGPTDLLPGPAISELGAVGLQVQIENGKITIRETKVIVKEGAKISQDAADIMNKLDIKPFSIGFIPLSAFDTQENKLYLDIKIDPETTINDLKAAFGKALPFAVEIGYVNEDTITFMIGKAGAYEKTLSALIEKDTPAEAENSEKAEPKEEIEVKAEDSEKTEPKEDAEAEDSEKTEPKEEKPETQTPENKSEESKSEKPSGEEK